MSIVPERFVPGLGAGPSVTRGSAPSLPRVNCAALPLAAALSASPGPKMPFGGGPPAAFVALPLAADTDSTAAAKSGSSLATLLIFFAPASLADSSLRCPSFFSQASVSAPTQHAAHRARAVLIVGV